MQTQEQQEQSQGESEQAQEQVAKPLGLVARLAWSREYSTWRDGLSEKGLPPIPALRAEWKTKPTNGNGRGRPVTREPIFSLLTHQMPDKLARCQPRAVYQDPKDDTIGTARCVNVDCVAGGNVASLPLSRFPRVGGWREAAFVRGLECRSCTEDRLARGESKSGKATSARRRNTRVDLAELTIAQACEAWQLPAGTSEATSEELLSAVAELLTLHTPADILGAVRDNVAAAEREAHARWQREQDNLLAAEVAERDPMALLRALAASDPAIAAIVAERDAASAAASA